MNPFSLSFGKEPINIINREKEINEIIEGFTADNPEYQVCMITGVRGSGKTVTMTEIASKLKKEKTWIVVEVSPERDMLRSLTAELSNRRELMQIFRDAKINLSFLGFGLEIDAEPPVTDIAIALDRMLEQITNKGRKVLITLDEAVSNQHIRVFVSQFQIYMRKNYNVFLLMTGLYERIYELQNEKTLTFLYRAPKVEMEPLNSFRVAQKYQQTFGVDTNEANSMARLVKGYPYAYQVLGYLCYKNQCSYNQVVDELDAYLGEYVYDKIWEELSIKDREVVTAIAKSSEGRIKSIRDEAVMTSAEFSVYRDRLLKKGIVRANGRGYLVFTLPRFKEYLDWRTTYFDEGVY